MNVREEFLTMLTDAVEETGADLQAELADVATYADERAAHLATITHEPGFPRAVRAERDSVAIRAGLDISDAAKAADQRLVGLIGGALSIAAKAIAAA